MGMPFGMIFALFLIVVFIVIAFIAVESFLDIGESAGVGMFYRELQSVVDDTLREQASEVSFDIDLPSEIEMVCFANLSAKITNNGVEYEAIRNFEVYEANVFLVPPEYAQGMGWKLIEHINVTRITEKENPFCVSAESELRIKKGFYDRLVWVGKDLK